MHTPRHNVGFTLFEVVIVLLLLGALATVAIGKGGISADCHVEAEILRGHIRYAQAMAVKDGGVWGLDVTGSQYVLTQVGTGNQVLPGETAVTVSLPAGVSATGLADIYFNAFGIPFSASTAASSSRLTTSMTITVSADGESETISITPDMGFVQ